MDPLTRLMTLVEDQNLSQLEIMREACQAINQLIPKANRVSLWAFEDNNRQIRSLVNFDAASNEFSEGIILKQADYPPYFKAIIEEDLVVASDARNHSVTNCFNQSYFEPLGIYSLLDFILHENFVATGVVCCESAGQKIEWSKDDIDNVRMVASVISFCFHLDKN
ncbi:MAG: hypothetical protein AseanaTS_26350 [Candidatus Pelagadaptatus aseana]|uniref:GAF domain-containing protein n=1 Tax=Candidatus Pelagadaptatus aseana TaxID=3120508 RepID=UPI0039B2D6A8